MDTRSTGASATGSERENSGERNTNRGTGMGSSSSSSRSTHCWYNKKCKYHHQPSREKQQQQQQRGSNTVSATTTTTTTTHQPLDAWTRDVANSVAQELKMAVLVPQPPPKKKKKPPASTAKRAAKKKRHHHGLPVDALPSWNDMQFEYMRFQAAQQAEQQTSNRNHQPKNESHQEIPDDWPVLQKFVKSQRTQYNSKTKQGAPPSSDAPDDPWALTPQRMAVLDFCGFVWRTPKPPNPGYEDLWQERYDKLVEYKKIHGHCNVPQDVKPLGVWVKTQRDRKKEADRRAHGDADANHRAKQRSKRPSLSADRIAQLDAIGFQWFIIGSGGGETGRRMPTWEERYQQLIQYKAVNGDTNVKQTYSQDRTLGKWVMHQRCEYSQWHRGKKTNMTPERRDKLNAIGFCWVSPRYHKKQES